MLRRYGVLFIVACLTIAILDGSADARSRHPVDAMPFAHAPCSVLAN
jgi:hypothetical protein